MLDKTNLGLNIGGKSSMLGGFWVDLLYGEHRRHVQHVPIVHVLYCVWNINVVCTLGIVLIKVQVNIIIVKS